MASELNLKSISALFTLDILQQSVNQICIKKGTKASDIAEHNVKFASNKGDGYLGVVYRINVILSDGQTFNIIGKGMPPNLVRRKTFESDTFFAKEVLFYNDIVPVFREFELKQRGNKACEEETLLAIPDCYYAMSDGDNDFLVMEDLVENGFAMAERSSGLDLVHICALLKTVARYHAFSYAMKSLEPEKFKQISQNIKEPIFHIDQENRLGKYFHNLAMLFHRAVKDELKGTEYLRKYEKFTEEKILFKNFISTVVVKEPAVIGHGDCWSTNFMFKGTNSNVQAKAIDFQIARYGSPMIDISLFVFSCTTSEQRDDAGGVKEILKIYYRELTAAVTSLGAPKCELSWEELCQHWSQVGAHGFGCAIELVPLSLVNEEDVQDLDRVEGEEATSIESLTQFSEITDAEGKRRLVDLIKLAVDEGML